MLSYNILLYRFPSRPRNMVLRSSFAAFIGNAPRVQSSPAWHTCFIVSRSQHTSEKAAESVNVGHSRFLAEASPGQKWKHKDKSGGFAANGGIDLKDEGFENLSKGKGKLSPTSSHLFKLILPLGQCQNRGSSGSRPNKSSPPPTVLLLHPSQPLSHVSRLILASIAPDQPSISFRIISSSGQQFQWSDSTDVGDFIRDAARATEFSICITYEKPSQALREDSENQNEDNGPLDEVVIDVEVPTFADRTRFLRRRLAVVQERLKQMEGLKRDCDREAHRGARRMAVGGFGMLVAYWGLVARLTFWDFGWDVMEPITYLSGLSTVICGYLWFLYQGREVSYSSVLDRSISQRREAQYKARGLDIDLWVELVGEEKALKREIRKIAEDYDEAREKAGDDDDDDDDTKDSKKPLPPPEPDTEGIDGGKEKAS